MNLCLVTWMDAVADEAGNPTPAKAQLVELTEVGFLLDENEDAILIGMESHMDEEVQLGRWRLSIPKGNIRMMRVVDSEKAFPRKTTRRLEV